MQKGRTTPWSKLRKVSTPDLKDVALYLAILKRNPGAQTWRDIRNWYEAHGCAEKLLTGERPPNLDGACDKSPVGEKPGEDEVSLALEELIAQTEQGTKILTPLCEEYPTNLRSTFDRPPFLFCRGNVPSHRKMVAVVGSRKASPNALKYADRLSRHLVGNGFCVVSGLAEGVDTAAHQAALGAKGETMAVVGTGITRYYPAKNRALQERMENEGAVLSQFFPDHPPQKLSFPMRNMVMSGIALATVVVEATEKSGTKSQAKGALKHGRMVFFTKFALAGAKWAQEMVGLPSVYVIESPEDLYGPLEEALNPKTASDFEQLALNI